MFVTLLSWIVLRTRFDTTNELEILVSSLRSRTARVGRRP
jgi:hypothetical protein